MSAAINSRNYDWKDIEIRFNGRLLTSIQNVAWKEAQDKKPYYGKGVNALGISRGNITVDGSISVLQDELETMLDEAPDGKLLNFTNLDMQVALAKNGVMVRYSILGIEFTEQAQEWAQNDQAKAVNLPFLALSVKRIG